MVHTTDCVLTIPYLIYLFQRLLSMQKEESIPSTHLHIHLPWCLYVAREVYSLMRSGYYYLDACL